MSGYRIRNPDLPRTEFCGTTEPTKPMTNPHPTGESNPPWETQQ